MVNLSDTNAETRHATVDADAFYRTSRERMNEAIDGPGHHPRSGYMPTAHRHYTRRLALLDRLKTLEFSSALDVGCAEGFFMAAIAEARGAEVWGVDLSDHAVTAAKQQRGLTVAAAEGSRLPFADGAFDLVYSTEVIEHVLDPAAMLAEMRRVSRRHVLITTPISQHSSEHPPDYSNPYGHINDFDEKTVRRLFGADADLRTFRCNGTFALITAVGRYLPAGPRDAFYRLDTRVAKRFGSPHGRFVPLRNRDWIILTTGTGEGGPREWRCPQCHGELTATDDGLRCAAENLTYGFAAPDVPDFLRPR
jgi:SAM-dependent methyltransferase